MAHKRERGAIFRKKYRQNHLINANNNKKTAFQASPDPRNYTSTPAKLHTHRIIIANEGANLFKVFSKNQYPSRFSHNSHFSLPFKQTRTNTPNLFFSTCKERSGAHFDHTIITTIFTFPNHPHNPKNSKKKHYRPTFWRKKLNLFTKYYFQCWNINLCNSHKKSSSQSRKSTKKLVTLLYHIIALPN